MSRDLILVAVSLFAWGLGESTFLSFQPLYLQQLGADPIRIGAILGVYGIANSLAHLPAGYLADRFGRRPLMWSAWLLGVLATWVMALASSLNGFVTGMLLYALTLFVLAPMNSYITAARGLWSVGRAITLISASYNLGTILGPLLGGVIATRFGFRGNFQLAAWIFVFSTLVIFLIRPQPIETKPARQSRFGTLLGNQRYLGFVALYFLVAFAMFLPQPLAPNFLQNQQGISLSEIGMLYSIGGLGIVLLSLILGRLENRTGFLLGQVAVGSFAFLIWQGHGLTWYMPAFFLLGGYRAARSLATAQVQTLVQPSNLGLAYGLAETVSSLATVLAPVLAGYLYIRQPVQIFSISTGAILLAALLSFFFLFRWVNDKQKTQPVISIAHTGED